MSGKGKWKLYQFINEFVDRNTFLKKQNMSAADFNLLFTLLRHGNTNGESFPGFDLIKEETGLSDSAIYRAFKQFEDMGLIKCIQRGGGGSRSFSKWKFQKPEVWLPAQKTSKKKTVKKKKSDSNEPTAEELLDDDFLKDC